jgi:2-oxo-hept-3-ene-1,7-dioate hydratase
MGSEGTLGAALDAARNGMARQLAMRSESLGAGVRHRGWKVAFTTPQAQAAAGLDRPAHGWLSARTELADGATVDVSTWTKPTIEGELALHLGDDLAVEGLGLAIEVVDVALPYDRLEDIVAGSIFHRGYILGAPGPADLEDPVIAAAVNGELIAEQPDPWSVLGRPEQIVERLQRDLAGHGHSLAPGDVILGGSAIGLHAVQAGDIVRVTGSSLGELTVTFA